MDRSFWTWDSYPFRAGHLNSIRFVLIGWRKQDYRLKSLLQAESCESSRHFICHRLLRSKTQKYLMAGMKHAAYGSAHYCFDTLFFVPVSSFSNYIFSGRLDCFGTLCGLNALANALCKRFTTTVAIRAWHELPHFFLLSMHLQYCSDRMNVLNVWQHDILTEVFYLGLMMRWVSLWKLINRLPSSFKWGLSSAM